LIDLRQTKTKLINGSFYIIVKSSNTFRQRYSNLCCLRTARSTSSESYCGQGTCIGQM